jgi:hypothetical protein
MDNMSVCQYIIPEIHSYKTGYLEGLELKLITKVPNFSAMSRNRHKAEM